MNCQILEVNISLSRASGRAKMNLWKAVIQYSYLNKRRIWTVRFSRSILAFPELQEELKWTSEKQSFNIHILMKDESLNCQILEVNISLSWASGRAKMNLWKAVIQYSYLNQRRHMNCQILEVNISLSWASGRAKMNLWKSVILIFIS